MAATVDELLAARRRLAQRELRNFRTFVNRRELTGWVKDRNACAQFRGSLRAIVALEDAGGVDAAAALGDRLREIRVDAMARGLLTAADVIKIEHEVCEEA